MKKVTIPGICLFLFSCLQAQVNPPSVRVVDAVSKGPLYKVLVFANHSSHYSLSDSAGNVVFTKMPEADAEYVFEKAGYQTYRYTFSAGRSSLPESIELQTAADVLQVNDSLLKDEQDRWGQLFVNKLLGSSPNANQCEVGNPDVLRFTHHDHDTAVLLDVKATAPLVIFNEALGYMLHCIINEFTIARSGKVTASLLVLFKPLSSHQQDVLSRWNHNRNDQYSNSIAHFLRSFYNNHLMESGFEIRKIAAINMDDPSYPEIRKSLKAAHKKQIQLTGFYGYNERMAYWIDRDPSDISSLRFQDPSSPIVSLDFKHYILQLTNGKDPSMPDYQVSYLYSLNGKPLSILPGQFHYNFQDIGVMGYWRESSLADQLPEDFKP